MPFNKNIPQPTDRIKASQNDLLLNNTSISDLIGVDHVNFDSPTGNQGKHNKVTFPNVDGGIPAITNDEIKVYSTPVGGISQLFILPENAEQNNVKFPRNITGGTRQTDGDIVLPCGIRVMWGSDQTDANGLKTFNFINGGFSNQIFSIVVSLSRTNGQVGTVDDGSIRVYEYDTNSFKVVSMRLGSSGTRKTVGFSWIAIGI